MQAILTAILAIFTAVGEWIVTAVEAMTVLFFADGALTFMGVLAVAGLAFSVMFLIIGIIQRFLHFAG